jgi:cytochrome P450
MKGVSRPPGPPSGIFGQLGEMRRDPIGLLTSTARVYGDIARYRILHQEIYQVSHPDHVRHVLQDHNRNYNKRTRGFEALRSFLANGLLTSEGAYWLRQRRIMQPAFHRARIAAFGEVMTGAAQAMMDRWRAVRLETVDVSAEMMRLTLQIVARTLLGVDVSQEADRVGRAVTIALDAATDAIRRPIRLPRFLPMPSTRRLKAALAELDAIVFGVIERRRRGDDGRGDLLDMLMQTRDEETGESMTDRQLRDEVMTIFVAGHETTAIALGWTWYLLAAHPGIRRRLQHDVDEILAARSPTMTDLPRLPSVDQTVKEVMRLYPPAWIISRRAIEDDEMGGYRVPAGTVIFASPYVTHRHPAFWDDPERFDPDRFQPGGPAERLPHFAYFPFGGGPRQCIGNSFAMMEMQLIVALMLQRCELDLAEGTTAALHPSITLRPAAPIRLKLKWR